MYKVCNIFIAKIFVSDQLGVTPEAVPEGQDPGLTWLEQVLLPGGGEHKVEVRTLLEVREVELWWVPEVCAPLLLCLLIDFVHWNIYRILA